MPGLSQIRRFEAAGFRAWPSGSTYYDGTWSIRLTPGHRSRRLNSINPLDPNDHTELEGRIQRATERFAAAGKPLTFRQTPLASRELDAWLDDRKFTRVHESTVMTASLDEMDFSKVIDMLPLKDAHRYASASAAIHGLSVSDVSGLENVIQAIKPAVGMFVLEDKQGPASCVMCVQDGMLAGLLDLGTREDVRGQGLGRAVMLSALKWARAHGSVMAWLQMDLSSHVAASLYMKAGFSEIYRYVYRVEPGTR